MSIPRHEQDPLESWVDELTDLGALARQPKAAEDELLMLLTAAQDSDVASDVSPSDASRMLESIRSLMGPPAPRFRIWPRVVTLTAAVVLAVATLLALLRSGIPMKHATPSSQPVITDTVRFEMASSGKHVRLELVVYRTGGINAP